MTGAGRYRLSRPQAHFTAGAQNTQRDLAPVCNYNFIKHVVVIRSLGTALVNHEQGLSIFNRVAVLCAN
jgi:hypothetical protein